MIDERAIVDANAQVHPSASIGPWTTIGSDVVIGEDTEIASHVVVKGPTTIGKRCKVFQFSSIGEDTPDLKYNGERTTLLIGDDNVIREGVTIHRGTIQDQGKTIVGDNNLIMAYTHIGHDCVIGSNCILVNNAGIAGHVSIGDWAIIGAYAGIHQYCQIGAHSFVGGMAKVTQDVPAFIVADGHPAIPRAVNVEGLRRREFDPDAIKALQTAYKIVYRRKLSLADALLELQKIVKDRNAVQDFIDSITSSQRGIIRG